MKKSIILIVFVFVSGISFSQGLRVNTYAGYVFPDSFDNFYSANSYVEGQIQDGFRWGVGLEYAIPGNRAIEIQYKRQDTFAPTTFRDPSIGGGGLNRANFDLGINWIMLNFTNYIPINETVEPFVGGGLGMGIFNVRNPDNGNTNNGTKFAWNIRGGSNFWVADNIAIRIQASLFSAVQSVGGGLFFGTGGAGAGISTYSTMYQFGFDGGLVFRLPGK
ncbi:porin family protein [Aquiflexum gelatinilyticum]|uniref:porin family protein n=1 Tax=Aquiflexum gelatinilyticum TaxID=2961943 RepID=UPI002166DA12|nr:porin family protein [Aquiflexum gelatinilyticum]MCS4436532.1 porin family protein [Aquiflexum gelatinilyticum]